MMECSICMNLLSEAPEIPLTSPSKKRKTQTKNPSAESLTVSTPCGHIFHRQCLQGWLKGSKGSCPSCRREFTMRSARPIFLDINKIETEATPSMAQLSTVTGGESKSKTVQKIQSEDSKQNSEEGEKSKPVAFHTDEEYSELQKSIIAMRKENEALKEKCSSEKERADANEATAKNLQEKQCSNPNSNQFPPSTSVGELLSVGCNSLESPAPAGGSGGSGDGWIAASLRYWWPKDRNFENDDEDNWGN